VFDIPIVSDMMLWPPPGMVKVMTVKKGPDAASGMEAELVPGPD
jgi:hypothetical protein